LLAVAVVLSLGLDLTLEFLSLLLNYY